MDAACSCGAVTFQTPLDQPLRVYLCHCNECRRQSGSAFGSSAIFPAFELPGKEEIGKVSRDCDSGSILDCYFCKKCGSRVIHTHLGSKFVSVKTGCILASGKIDWKNAHHIWTSCAVVDIPKGALCSNEEPEETEEDLLLLLEERFKSQKITRFSAGSGMGEANRAKPTSIKCSNGIYRVIDSVVVNNTKWRENDSNDETEE